MHISLPIMVCDLALLLFFNEELLNLNAIISTNFI